MVRKRKVLVIYFIVNIILDYPKRTGHNVTAITTNIQRGVL